ncbi:MAG TPA: hypothetical protein DCL77_15845 [Prolixibacteraceae bacterium]|jgi:hypothetical protein|nr:hypothetical protein [Prolixibacteraceae bacterium]
MKTIKLIIGILFAGGLITSCIERYFPGYESEFIPQLVIEGTISPDEGEQEIVISNSSSPDDPKFIAVSGCGVQVEDEKGNQFNFPESTVAGHYRGRIDGDKVIIGTHYRLLVQTPEGKQYASSYEELLPCPPIDSLYFDLETKLTSDPNKNLNGLQFYIDFKGNDSYGHYYRLEAIETYEYHSKWPLDKWQDRWGGRHNLEEPDFSNFICYKTTKLRNIFDLSTDGFSKNSYSNYRLHFVKDQTQQLQYKYSLLVNQYSLDKKAFNYWENLRKNNQETVDLFGKQPSWIKGNIYNVNDTTDFALGYFGVSTVQSKRIMVHPFEGLSFDKAQDCKAYPISGKLPTMQLLYFANDLDENFEPYEGIAAAECIFCQLLGGTTQKPSYWDEK